MNTIEIGNFIADSRKRINLTQKDLAEKVCVSDKTISKWETGKSLPDMVYMENLCKTLGISVNELITARHLEESDFADKSDKTLISLIDDIERNKKGSRLLSISGIILCAFSIFLLFSSSGRGLGGLKEIPGIFFDLLSFAFVIFPVVGILLLSRKTKTAEKLQLLNHVLIPVGLASSIANFIIMTNSSSDSGRILQNICVVILPLFYAAIIKIFVSVFCHESAD